MASYKFVVIVGSMGSGKSYYTNELIGEYKKNGWLSIVYNLGKPTDFSQAREIIPLTTAEHLRLLKDKEARNGYKIDPFLFYYKELDGTLKKWQEITSLPPRGIIGDAIKFPRLDSLSERLFFDVVFSYASTAFIVFDDMKASLTHGLKEEFRNLFSRVRHAGRNALEPTRRAQGVSIAIILHSLNDINPDLFTFITHIVMFKTAFEPDFSRFDINPKVKEEVKKCYNFLSNAPEHTHTITNVMDNISSMQKQVNKPYFSL